MELINKELEASVLGSIINNDTLYMRVIDIISVDIFNCPVHARLFMCLKDEFHEAGSISKVRLLHRFTDIKGQDGEKLKQNLIEICSVMAAPLAIRNDVKALVDLKQRRDMKGICEATLLELTGDNQSLDIASGVLGGFTKVISSSTMDNSTTIGAEFEVLYNQSKEGVAKQGSPTGLPMLDVAMEGGLQRGRVYAFIAKAKCGKTMLATTISNALCDNAVKHAFICAEMGSLEVSARMLGQRIDKPTEAFKMRNSADTLDRIAKETIKVKDNVVFENEPAIDFDKLKALVEKHVYKNKIEGFILDYYQLVTGQQRHQSHAQHLEDVANWIHRVSKKHNIWCLLLVQANDQGQVLGSRGIDRACDQKYMIERPLDEQGDPIGEAMWLKMKLSRYTRLIGLGSEQRPSLQIHKNGTHIEQLN